MPDPGAHLSAAELFRREAPFVARILARLGVPDSDLDDAVQEVFLTVHRRGGFVVDGASPRTWLAEIGVRVAANVRRTRRRRPTDVLDGLSDALTATGADPCESTLQRERLDRIAQALESLAVAHRVVFVLFEIEGEPCESIARGLGVPIGTVYSRLHLARRAFRAAYERIEGARAEMATPPMLETRAVKVMA